MDVPEIEQMFEKLRTAGNGAVVKLDSPDKGQLIEGIIFEPGPARPAGYETGIFLKVPADSSRIYYLDPDASRKQGKIIMQLLDIKKDAPAAEETPEELLNEYNHLRQAPDVKLGGGAAREANSKATGTIDLNQHT